MQRTEKKHSDILSFGEEFPDGRLCAEPSGKKYRIRDAIQLVEQLGRPLTEEEYERFREK